MRQTSLLDSFIKRQNKKNEQTNKSSQQSIDKKVSEDKKKRQKIRKNQINSDDESQEQYLEQIKNQIQDLDFNQQSQQKNRKSRVNKSRGKSKQKNKKQKNNIKTTINQNNQQQDPLAHFTDATPIWAQRQHCIDIQKRTPKDPNYDCTTLYVPEEAWSKFTAPMRQFWKIKSQNFDKVILFKLGKFYELFYDDAAIANKYLDLKFMGTKMHAGFPEKCLDKYVSQLVELGFKTVVVQQMETPQQMQQRVALDKKTGRKSQKTINRQVTQILTRGTYISKQQKQTIYLPNYLFSLRSYGQIYAFSLLQIGTNNISMGTLDSLDKLKTLLFQTRPSQLIYDPDNLNSDIVRMMEKTFLQMQISKVINKNNIWHPLHSINQLNKLQKQDKIKKSKIFQLINQFDDINRNLLYATLSGLFQYLKKVFKFQYVIVAARFSFYQKDSQKKYMVLDSQALLHLEIFQTPQGVQDSLFNKIDKTKTKFGKRLLRKWLMSPLMNQFHINQRLNAIQDIDKISIDKGKITSILKKLPDLDKKVNKLYHYAIKTTSASKAVYFEDINTARLKQFKEVMQKMEQGWEAINFLGTHCKQFKSMRLKQLVTLNKIFKVNEQQFYAQNEDDQSCYQGLLPDVLSHLNQFKSYVKWDGNTPIPQKGLVSQFDQLQNSIDIVKNDLDKYLDKVRYEMNEPNLKYVHTKQRYEIQIPQKAEKRKPAGFQFSSKRSGYSRYLCDTVKKLVKSLEKIQEDIKQQMGLFIGFFFQQFKKKQKVWQRFVQILAQVDCLISLSQYSFTGHKTRPCFCDNKFQIRGARHPCLTNIQFIPNDISLQKKVMLLTGPNMGGKSTMLRTVCNLAILAQIGCYVPAQNYNCEVVDRIFTRIGASDRLQLGKSTFFIQMQETKSILQHATNRSLAIIDELGRGTSTFDGLAIAYSVLKNIIQNLRCFCLFATHYHILIDQFKNRKQVQLMMMDSLLKQNHIIFLYKLVTGYVTKSFGLNVASRVGVGKQMVEIAEIEANKMNTYIEGKRQAVFKHVLKFLNQKDY